MPEVKEYTIFKFDELNDGAKEKARDWFREASAGDEIHDSTYEDAATIGALMGIGMRLKPVKLMDGNTRYDAAIYYSGFSSQGDGACFEANYSYRKGALNAVKDHAPKDLELHRIARELQDVQKRYFYRLNATSRLSGRHSHSGTMSIECEIDNSIYQEPDSAACEAVTQALRDFADWIYKALESEYEYRNADEQVDDSIRANEYTFDANGRRED
jgi:hypothetical protein